MELGAKCWLDSWFPTTKSRAAVFSCQSLRPELLRERTGVNCKQPQKNNSQQHYPKPSPPVTITFFSLQKSNALTPLYTLNTVWSLSIRRLGCKSRTVEVWTFFEAPPLESFSWDSTWVLPIVWPEWKRKQNEYCYYSLTSTKRPRSGYRQVAS